MTENVLRGRIQDITGRSLWGTVRQEEENEHEYSWSIHETSNMNRTSKQWKSVQWECRDYIYNQ